MQRQGGVRRDKMSPSSRRAWIEIPSGGGGWLTTSSPSSRRAWIEIIQRGSLFGKVNVALLAEGVDRNFVWQGQLADSKVALLAEGVDRNLESQSKYLLKIMSPSSRRAWIEIESGDVRLVGPDGRPPRGGRG